tara:strand:+ start:3792 stop:4340 length:549 start_codon:yes stop_codon:yes gene_type:complete
MQIQEAIVARRTIHSFNSKKVSPQIINRAIRAANYAPCHYLSFPWRFTSLDANKRDMIAELAIKIKFIKLGENKKSEENIRSKIITSSHLIVVSQIVEDDPKKKIEDYAACSCAIQNLSLSLISDGVGCKWSTGIITTNQNTYEIAEIDPASEEIIGFLFIGYGDIPSPIKRLPISTIFREK